MIKSGGMKKKGRDPILQGKRVGAKHCNDILHDTTLFLQKHKQGELYSHNYFRLKTIRHSNRNKIYNCDALYVIE